MCFEVTGNKISKSSVPLLKCTHEKAATGAAFHAKQESERTAGSNIIVTANNTDIFIILLYHIEL